MTFYSRKNAAPEDFDEIAGTVSAEWRRIAAQPHLLTDLSAHRVMFAAGGGLVTEFGDETSEIWRALRDKVARQRDELQIAGQSVTRREMEAVFGDATGEIWKATSEVASEQTAEVEIAGVVFNRQDLEAIGDCYRWLKRHKGFTFHCIDERLKDDLRHTDKEVHVNCGACAAVGEATGLANVEDLLLARSAAAAKQENYADMPNHRSMTIFVDFTGAGVVLGSERRHLRSIGGLSFNVSLQTSLLEEYLAQSGIDRNLLLAALVKWNVQIARNIIGGAQNELRPLADRTILVVDTRGLDVQNPVVSDLIKLVLAVAHRERLAIGGPVS